MNSACKSCLICLPTFTLVIAGGARVDSEIPYENSVRQAIDRSGAG